MYVRRVHFKAQGYIHTSVTAQKPMDFHHGRIWLSFNLDLKLSNMIKHFKIFVQAVELICHYDLSVPMKILHVCEVFY